MVIANLRLNLCGSFGRVHNASLTFKCRIWFCFFSGLSTVAKLIGCNINELKLALSKRNMRVGNDTIVQKLTLSQVGFL